MDIFRQAKAKGKSPPPPPPKPSHLSQSRGTPPVPNTRPTDKRGIGWPWDYQPDLFPLFTLPSSEKRLPQHHQQHQHQPVTWLFNWELWVPPGLPRSIEWVPCVRTGAQCRDVIPFLTDITTKQGRPIRHFLGFNEPEIPSQANLGVDEAVALWRDVVLPAKRKFGFRLGSPGLSSDAGRSIGWLDEFLAKLGGKPGTEELEAEGGGGGAKGAKVDFLVLHWYGPHFADMRSFLEMMHERYCMPVWVNEFACTTMGQGEAASQHDVESFLQEAMPWLESCAWIERYAYYGNGQGLDVGTWVGRASNFTEQANDKDHERTGGKRLTRTGQLYLGL